MADFAPGQRCRHRRAGIGAHHIRRGDGLGLPDLQIVEIDLALLTARHRARRSEQVRALGGYQTRDDFRERAHLLVRVDRLQRHIDVHAVAAGGLRISFQTDQVQLLAHKLRSLDDPVVFAPLRIQVDQHEVRALERPHAAHPRILIDAAEVGQVQQRRAIVRQHATRGGFFVVGVNRLHAHPRRKAVVRVLLEEEFVTRCRRGSV